MSEPQAAASDLDGTLAALADLPELLQRARGLLPALPRPSDGLTGRDDDGVAGQHSANQALPQVLDAALQALQGVADLTQPRAWRTEGGFVALLRDGHRLRLCVLGELGDADAAFARAALGRWDQRLLCMAELVGRLLGLCTAWLVAGFAPPLVVKSLAEHAAQIGSLATAIQSLDATPH